ncbi:MAG: hypothetical protein DCF21_20000 [Leptolyngbya sp.]|jgi:hypothetical protein|nr:MAG: hypothetical protein DCF21_20000 [Leptolyngbya sp.]
MGFTVHGIRADREPSPVKGKLFLKCLQLRDSGHNHQGVNSLAHRKNLLKQTRELGSQSSSEDFGFEPWTSSPRLSGPSKELTFPVIFRA